jgi:hypothetical protein
VTQKLVIQNIRVYFLLSAFLESRWNRGGTFSGQAHLANCGSSDISKTRFRGSVCPFQNLGPMDADPTQVSDVLEALVGAYILLSNALYANLRPYQVYISYFVVIYATHHTLS